MTHVNSTTVSLKEQAREVKRALLLARVLQCKGDRGRQFALTTTSLASVIHPYYRHRRTPAFYARMCIIMHAYCRQTRREGGALTAMHLIFMKMHLLLALCGTTYK